MNQKLRRSDNGLGWILKWAVPLSFIILSGVAWGQQAATTDSQGKRLTTAEKAITLLLQRTTRIDERTIAIVKSQDQARDDRNEIIRLLRKD